jgi:hypothetical protein
MKFSMKTLTQSQDVENYLKARMYQKLHAASKKTGWVRLTGPGVGLASGLMTIAKRVAIIGEAIIKGVGNLFGAPFSKQCSLKHGLANIFLVLPANILCLPFSITSAVVGLFSKTIFMACNPKSYTYERWRAHDPHPQNPYKKPDPAKENTPSSKDQASVQENTPSLESEYIELEVKRAMEAKRKELEAKRAEEAKQKALETKQAEEAKQKALEAKRAEEAKRKELEAKRAEEAKRKEKKSPPPTNVKLSDISNEKPMSLANFERILNSNLPPKTLFKHAENPYLDRFQRYQLLKKASEKEYGPAMYEYGCILLKGLEEKAPQNTHEAIQWIHKAGTSKTSDRELRRKAFSLLGEVYLFGKGVPQDRAAAKKYYERALAFGTVTIKTSDMSYGIRKADELDDVFQEIISLGN